MDIKLLVSIVVVGVFVITFFVFQQISSVSGVNPIDPNQEFADYQLSESNDITTYDIIGEIAGITDEYLMIMTGERVLTIKKPDATEYVTFVPRNLPISEDELRQKDFVRTIVNVSKSTNEIVALTVTVVGRIRDGKIILPSVKLTESD